MPEVVATLWLYPPDVHGLVLRAKKLTGAIKSKDCKKLMRAEHEEPTEKQMMQALNKAATATSDADADKHVIDAIKTKLLRKERWRKESTVRADIIERLFEPDLEATRKRTGVVRSVTALLSSAFSHPTAPHHLHTQFGSCFLPSPFSSAPLVFAPYLNRDGQRKVTVVDWRGMLSHCSVQYARPLP